MLQEAKLTGIWHKPVVEVAVVVLDHASLLCVASVLDPLRNANRHLGYEAWRWRILSPGRSEVPLTCGLTIPAAPGMDTDGADLMLVIAGFRIPEVATPAAIRAVRRAARGVPVLGAIEAGAWLLAKAGLLDGHRATTHWEEQEDFAAAFPAVTVVPDRFVAGPTRLTAGGAGPAFDLMLHLIEARHGAQLALEVAHSFIAARTGGGVPQARPAGGADPRVALAVRLMQARIETPPRVAEIAAQAGLTPRRLESLFRAAYATTPGAFFLGIRLQAAQRLLVDTRHPLALVAARTGFSSPATFARAFRARFGTSPRRYRAARAAFSGYLPPGATA
jgi:transcriptional regulator GlxA family with amidase domain